MFVEFNISNIKMVWMLSLGFSLYNMYHFMNPLYFIRADSKILMALQLMGILIFVMGIQMRLDFTIVKVVSLLVVVFGVFMGNRKHYI